MHYNSRLTKQLTVAVITIFCFASSTTANATQPGIFCYVIGVTDNPGMSLKAPKEAAERFATTVSNLFPSAQIKLFTSPGSPATPEAVDAILREEIPQIPRYSTIIFYFSGHGLQKATSSYDEDLHLLLSGANRMSYRRKSLRFADLVDVLSRTKMINGLIFLDSCESGSAVDVTTLSGQLVRSANQVSPRFVYFFAAGPKQETFSGVFTTRFIDIWRTLSKDSSCVTPTEIGLALKKANLGSSADSGYRTHRMLPDENLTWCISNFGKPSTLLMFVPAEGYRDNPRITFDDGFQESLEFDRKQHPFFMRFVPKDRPLFIGLKTRHTELTNSLHQSDLVKDVIVFEVGSHSLSQLTPEDRLAGLDAAAVSAISDIGLHEAGPSARSVDFLEMAGRNLARSGNIAKAKTFYRLASDNAEASKANLLALALAEPPEPQTLNSLNSFEQQIRYLSDYELFNGLGTGAGGWRHLLDQQLEATNKLFVRTRAALSLRASGQMAESEEIEKQLRGMLATNDVFKADEFIATLEFGTNILQRYVAGVIVETPEEWQSTRGIYVPKPTADANVIKLPRITYGARFDSDDDKKGFIPRIYTP